MRVIAKKKLITFWMRHPDSEQALRAWYDEAAGANWRTPNEIKAQYKSASVVGKNRVVFNIAGNKYRLIVAIAYQFGAIYIKFVGSHQEYDKVDALTVG
jgi:mRNA interferase HigB